MMMNDEEKHVPEAVNASSESAMDVAQVEGHGHEISQDWQIILLT